MKRENHKPRSPAQRIARLERGTSFLDDLLPALLTVARKHFRDRQVMP